jgi:hypothetical protein
MKKKIDLCRGDHPPAIGTGFATISEAGCSVRAVSYSGGCTQDEGT